MTYNFPQFKTEIVKPTIEVDLNTIQDKAIDKFLSVSVVLTSEDGSKFGLDNNFVQFPYSDTWEDSEIEAMVVEFLNQYAI